MQVFLKGMTPGLWVVAMLIFLLLLFTFFYAMFSRSYSKSTNIFLLLVLIVTMIGCFIHIADKEHVIDLNGVRTHLDNNAEEAKQSQAVIKENAKTFKVK